MLNLYDEFENLIARLNETEIDYALCGGLALAVYAQPRATVDIDVLIPESSLSALADLVVELGFEIKAAPMNFKNGETIIHRYTKIDPSDGDFLSVDFLLVTEANRRAWEDIRSLPWKGRQIHVVSPKGLITLKLLRNSDQDRVDIENLKDM